MNTQDTTPPLPKAYGSACDHDLEAIADAGPVQRATWICPDCGQDVSFLIALWHEAAISLNSPNDELSDRRENKQ